MNRSLIRLAGFLFFPFLAALGQSPQSATVQSSRATVQSPATTMRSTPQEVVLDMTFRDKKGRTIHDIRPEEIHVLEDGIEQKLSSFQQTTATASATTGAKLSFDPMREIRLVTLVFEGLDQNGRRFFRGALKDILDMAPEQNLYFSVLVVDQRLHVIQPFTADHAALLKAVDRSATWSFVQYQNNSTQVKAELAQVLAQGAPSLGSGGGGAPSPSAVQGQVSYMMAKMQYDMLQAAEAADREYNARATIDALKALVRAQSELPGRKVVLYFNPGLLITEAVKEQYANLVSAANRANISFYTVDPQGLIALSDQSGSTRNSSPTFSQEDQGRDMLSDATGAIRAKQMSEGVGGGNNEVTTQEARATESAESALRANPLLWLRDLARQTGGATIADTNDYRAPLRVAMDEVKTYYEASYIPHIDVYDGKFRKISVRVDRPDVMVHTRSGYFALPQLRSGEQLYAYEMPLLNALNAAEGPHDIPFDAAAERFNDHAAKVEYMVTVETPEKELTFAPQPDQKTAALNATLLAVIRNSSGEIVEKFSKEFPVQVTLDKVDAYKAGNLVQTFRTELAPGGYTLEAAVMDRNSNKLSVRKGPITVPRPSTKLSLSDVVVVRQTYALKDNAILNAFYFPGGEVIPTLSDTLKGGPGNILPFYFAVYPDRSIKDAPTLTMSFYKEGQYLGAAEAPLPEVQSDGRIPYIANLPADKFTPGKYEIRIGVTQGRSKVEENVDFAID